jgi:hypothetical protein
MVYDGWKNGERERQQRREREKDILGVGGGVIILYTTTNAMSNVSFFSNKQSSYYCIGREQILTKNYNI